MKNIKGNIHQIKTMLKICSKYHWELKKIISSRSKEGSYLFVGDIRAEFKCHHDRPTHAIFDPSLTIRSDGTVDLNENLFKDDPYTQEIKKLLEAAHVSTEPTRKLGSGIK